MQIAHPVHNQFVRLLRVLDEERWVFGGEFFESLAKFLFIRPRLGHDRQGHHRRGRGGFLPVVALPPGRLNSSQVVRLSTFVKATTSPGPADSMASRFLPMSLNSPPSFSPLDSPGAATRSEAHPKTVSSVCTRWPPLEAG